MCFRRTEEHEERILRRAARCPGGMDRYIVVNGGLLSLSEFIGMLPLVGVNIRVYGQEYHVAWLIPETGMIQFARELMPSNPLTEIVQAGIPQIKEIPPTI